jgi:mannose-6-phosphate isomerase-like protein (cupin superfamily)
MADAIAPDGSEIYFLVGNADRASLVEVRLPAGSTSRAVRHRTVEEIWYFLAGAGRVWRRPPRGEPLVSDVEPGRTLVIPTGWAFQFQAGSDAELRFLCYTSPPWPGDQEAEPVLDGGL